MIAPRTMAAPRILIVDDDDSVRNTLRLVLEANQFEVVTATGVNEALAAINAGTFDVLLCDLQMPDPGDGLTVVSAMRHSNPEAITLIFSGLPAIPEALSAILLQADDILVKPMETGAMIDLIRQKLDSPKNKVKHIVTSVAEILERNCGKIIQTWYETTLKDEDLASLQVTFAERTFYLHRLMDDLIVRLRLPKEAPPKASASAQAHGKLRHSQGYSIPMLVQESRVLQVSIFESLKTDLGTVDFSLVLGDVMTIADEVDSQLKQMTKSYLEAAEPIAERRIA